MKVFNDPTAKRQFAVKLWMHPGTPDRAWQKVLLRRAREHSRRNQYMIELTSIKFAIGEWNQDDPKKYAGLVKAMISWEER